MASPHEVGSYWWYVEQYMIGQFKCPYSKMAELRKQTQQRIRRLLNERKQSAK